MSNNVNGYKVQEPSNPDNWLYQDWAEDDRHFYKTIRLPENAPLLPECTDEEKRKWEEEHPQPEPPEPEPEPNM